MVAVRANACDDSGTGKCLIDGVLLYYVPDLIICQAYCSAVVGCCQQSIEYACMLAHMSGVQKSPLSWVIVYFLRVVMTIDYNRSCTGTRLSY
ncbi:hypothetical protein RSAG8_13695, partial [Rhizoctonia solani AG-8 WAC10335]